jgi:hypothetical protein
VGTLATAHASGAVPAGSHAQSVCQRAGPAEPPPPVQPPPWRAAVPNLASALLRIEKVWSTKPLAYPATLPKGDTRTPYPTVTYPMRRRRPLSCQTRTRCRCCCARWRPAAAWRASCRCRPTRPRGWAPRAPCPAGTPRRTLSAPPSMRQPPAGSGQRAPGRRRALVTRQRRAEPAPAWCSRPRASPTTRRPARAGRRSPARSPPPGRTCPMQRCWHGRWAASPRRGTWPACARARSCSASTGRPCSGARRSLLPHWRSILV